MSLLDDIKAKADANGDGSLNMDDLNSLKDQLSPGQFDQLKEKLLGSDGKLTVDDIQNNLGDVFNDIKDSLGGFFK